MSSSQYFAGVADKWDAMRQVFFSDEVRKAAFRAAGIDTRAILSLAADIGAGTGFITEELVRAGLRVVAVDPVPEMLAVLAKKPYAAAGNVECKQGEAERLPLADASVDFAFANMSLHHVGTPASAISEMCRVLKPNGRAVITDMDEHGFEDLSREHNDRWMGFPRADVASWMSDAGFADISIGSVGECCGGGIAGTGIGIFVASGRRPA